MLHGGLHATAVAADVDDRTRANQFKHLFLLGPQQILDVGALPVEPRKGDLEIDNALVGEALQLVGIDEIVIGVAATEEQERLDPMLVPWPSAPLAPAEIRGTARGPSRGRS